jgi:hypothetical protein
METGGLTLALSGANADAFTVETQNLASLPAGGETDITLTPRADLAAGMYTAILTVSGEGLTPVSVTITYTVMPTGVEHVETQNFASLRAVSANGGLQVRGLVAGETFAVYNMSGQLIYNAKATTSEQFVPLNVRGIYIVVSGNRRVKTVY